MFFRGRVKPLGLLAASNMEVGAPVWVLRAHVGFVEGVCILFGEVSALCCKGAGKENRS